MLGIKRLAKQPHRREITGRKHPIQIATFVSTNPVLAADAASRIQTDFQNCCTELFHPLLDP